MEKTNPLLELARSRQSDRAYDAARPVEAEKLERILEAARLAPSACNAQPWHFTVVTDPQITHRMGRAAASLGMNKFAKDAPVHILITEESANFTSFLGSKIKDKYFPLIDIGIAAAHITLAAEAEGLGSCILGWFDEKAFKALAGIPEEAQAEEIAEGGAEGGFLQQIRRVGRALTAPPLPLFYAAAPGLAEQSRPGAAPVFMQNRKSRGSRPGG